MRALLFAVALVAIAVTVAPELLHACPGCKETVRDQPASTLSAGFNYTVFGLIGMVFGSVATVATVIVRAYRRDRG